MIRPVKEKVEDLIPVRNVLVSVSNKDGLHSFIGSLVNMNPDMHFISTGGTYKTMREILGSYPRANLTDVSEYTGFPEMEGGLVKTLHPKIFAGILGERNNAKHQEFLSNLGNAVYLDMVVVNLYPFEQTIAKPGISFEEARGNIDIGGPAMLRAAAKNFLGCLPVFHPLIYTKVIEHLKENNGSSSLEFRLNMARKVFGHTYHYDHAVAKYMEEEIAKHGPAVITRYFDGGAKPA
jgi:phosphoribosylaminoimidazolecarboxamide formyltransferase/IMP cyclohydrolase